MSSADKETVDLAEDEFVVARIAGMKTVGPSRYYLVEWEGYGLTDNTWEEQSNIHSKDTINAFIQAYKRQSKAKKSSILSSTKKMLLKNTFDPDTQSYFPPPKAPVAKKTGAAKEVIAAASASIIVTSTTTSAQQQTLVLGSSSNNNISSNHLKLSSHKNHHTISTTTTTTTTKKRARELIESETESVLVSKPVKEARIGIENLSIEACTEFEQRMEKVKDSVEVKYPILRMANHRMINKRPVFQVSNLKTKVTVVNEIDSDLPTNFIYIDDLKYTDPVQPPDPDFLPGCICQKQYAEDCSQGCHDVVAYDNNGRLLIKQGTAIYECNQACECDKTCKNRVVQRGRKIPLQVFKTSAKGWGVRSTQFIHKGTFIEEYIGEVIKVDEGDFRGQVYDKLGCSYLFDMDFAQSELPTKYVIDSYMLGNVSRFFNHSCSPNLEVYAVFYDSADNQMHRLAFFAKRDIQKDEELCFDYNGRRDVAADENVEDAARYSCHCNSTECRKWIYH